MLSVPKTVVETPGFIRDAGAALTDEERTEMISTGYALDSGSPNSLWFAPEQFWGLGDV